MVPSRVGLEQFKKEFRFGRHGHFIWGGGNDTMRCDMDTNCTPKRGLRYYKLTNFRLVSTLEEGEWEFSRI